MFNTSFRLPAAWRIAGGCAAFATLLTAAAQAQAQPAAYPTRPVTVIVPQQAGSNSDNVIRPLAAMLQDQLGQVFNIDNKAGANGIIGAEAAARAKPDGSTLLVASSTTFSANPGLYKKLAYDPVRDFRAVANLGKTSMLFAVRQDFAGRTLDDLLTTARRSGKPLDVGYGSSTAHIAISLLSAASGVAFNAIPYKGTPQLVTDMIGGVLDIGVVDVGNGAQHIANGRLRGLAITDTQRSSFVPDVPTLAELFPRQPGTALVSWIGLVAPAGTPDSVVRTLQTAVQKALERPEMAQRFAAAGTTVAYMPAAALDQLIRDEIPRWNTLLRAAGIERE